MTFAAQPFAGPGRQGTITVAGQTVRVSQGSGCTFAVAPTSFNLPATGGNDTISVTTTAGCGWTAQSNAPWLTVSPSGGSGSGAVTLTALANTGAQRQDTITVAGQTITVIEAALCPYSVSPTSVSLPSGGGQGVVTVTTAAGCAWAAQSNVPWITVNGGGGVGPGRFTYSVVFNVGPGRTGQVLVGLGDPLAVFTVNQALGLGSQPESQE